MELSLSQALLEWYRQHQRPLPWRQRSDPYAVWVAEIMLQQTRVETVIPYFVRWMERFPDVNSLAQASEEEVLRLWEGLGYYQRARNLWRAAQRIVQEHGGKLPSRLSDLRHLPGIGDYTAAAIAAFAFGQDEVALDGNLERVLTRLFDQPLPAGSAKTRRALKALARQHLPAGQAAEYNQALMDLGATICLPLSPRCEVCPVEAFCLARAHGTVSERPLPRAGRAIPLRFQFIAIVTAGEKVLLHRRPGRGLLGGLWEFPSLFIESEEAVQTAPSVFAQEYGLHLELRSPLGRLSHAYTHFRLQAEAWHCDLLAPAPPNFTWVERVELSQYPMGKVARQIARRLIAQQPTDFERL